MCVESVEVEKWRSGEVGDASVNLGTRLRFKLTVIFFFFFSSFPPPPPSSSYSCDLLLLLLLLLLLSPPFPSNRISRETWNMTFTLDQKFVLTNSYLLVVPIQWQPTPQPPYTTAPHTLPSHHVISFTITSREDLKSLISQTGFIVPGQGKPTHFSPSPLSFLYLY